MAEYISFMGGEHRDEVVTCPRCARRLRATTAGWDGHNGESIREVLEWRCPCGCYGASVFGEKRVYGGDVG